MSLSSLSLILPVYPSYSYTMVSSLSYSPSPSKGKMNTSTISSYDKKTVFFISQMSDCVFLYATHTQTRGHSRLCI